MLFVGCKVKFVRNVAKEDMSIFIAPTRIPTNEGFIVGRNEVDPIFGALLYGNSIPEWLVRFGSVSGSAFSYQLEPILPEGLEAPERIAALWETEPSKVAP